MKRGFFYLILVVSTLVAVEVIARLLFATQIGPRILLYGTPWHRQEQQVEVMLKVPRGSAQYHENLVGDYRVYQPDKSGSYAKYFPFEKKFTLSPDASERYAVRINNHGFRGPDFEIQKQAGSLRVLTLGASSTFGYHNRDDETYPHALEKILNGATGGRPRFEVINFAIAHAITDNILAMFLAEGLALDPDFVTVYAGVNDSAVLEESFGGAFPGWQALRRSSVVMELAGHSITRFTAPDEIYWSQQYAQHRSQVYLDNLQALREECEKREIVFIVASQQATALWVEAEERSRLSYREEVELVKQQRTVIEARTDQEASGSRPAPFAEDSIERPFERLRLMLDPARVLLVHSRLMQDLEQWASETNANYVDAIELLDGRRHLLTSWVHLAPEANLRFAQALADTILQRLP